MEPDPLDGQHQLVFVRSRALKEAVKWSTTPGTRPSDVVAAAVWFEDYLLNGEHYQRPGDGEDTTRNDTPLAEGGRP